MSWDASVEYPPCSACGRTGDWHEIGNYTHNCNSMMRKALDATGQLEPLGDDHLYALNGLPCVEIGPILDKAMNWWQEHADEMVELNPSNGWGDADSAYNFWRRVATACVEHPKARLRMHG
jgi:hypothetical protein